MHTLTKLILCPLLALSAWAVHAQPVTISPTSAVIYVNDTVEFIVFCPDGHADAMDVSGSRVLTAKTIRGIGTNRGSGPNTAGRSFLANQPGVAKLQAYCANWKVPAPVPAATLTVLAKGNGKGRFAPTALSIAVGASGKIVASCDGGARSAVTNSDPSIAGMAISGNQVTFSGLREGKTGIALTCDTVAAGSAQITVTPTAASVAQVAYDKAKANAFDANTVLTNANNALAVAQTGVTNAIAAKKRASDAFATQITNCRAVPGCVAN